MKRLVLLAAVSAAILSALPAFAIVPIKVTGSAGTPFTITVTSGANSGSWTLPSGSLNLIDDGIALYSNPTLNLDIRDSSNNILATLNSLTLVYQYDPVISVAFAVTAGNTNTTVQVSSGSITGLSMFNPGGNVVSAGVTVTDNNGANGNPNEATATGNFSGKLYKAVYNTTSTFSTLISTTSAPGLQSNDSNDSYAGVIPGTVTDMESQFDFTLTAGDSASVSSVFAVVPEPSGILALAGGLAGLGLPLIRRKR